MAENAKKETKKLTFAELTAMKLGDLCTHLKKIVRIDTAITKAKEAFTSTLHFHGKCVAALKRLYVERLNAREIPPDTTFKKFFEQNAGGSLPGRVEALASLFNALVLTLDKNGKPLLSEENFDAAAIDWLEKANPIVKDAMKAHGENWKQSPEVQEVLGALSSPGDALKKIKEIRKRQKGQEGEETPAAGEAVPLTLDRAFAFIEAAIIGAKSLSDEEGYSLYARSLCLTDAWAKSGIPDDTLNAWVAKHDARPKGVAPHVEIVNHDDEPAPAAQPEPETEPETAEAVAA